MKDFAISTWKSAKILPSSPSTSAPVLASGVTKGGTGGNLPPHIGLVPPQVPPHMEIVVLK